MLNRRAPSAGVSVTIAANDCRKGIGGHVVDQLQRDGLVERERREDDARSFDAVLTPEGRKRLRDANEAHLKRVRELFLNRLSDTQLKQLGSVWRKIDPELVGDAPMATR